MEEKIRKLQKLGGSFYLSLPAQWLSRFSLDKGGEVVISTEESGEIRIFPQKKEEEKETRTIINYDKYIFRNLIAQYLFGKDIIEIKKISPFTKKEREKVFGFVNNLLNLEVIEEGSDIITIQNLKSDIPMKKMIYRMYFLTKTMMEDIIENSNDKEVLRNIIERDKTVGKFYFAIIMYQRELLTKRWSKEFTLVEILDLRLFIERLEQIGDGVKEIVNKLLNKKIKLRKESIKFLLKKYEEAYKAYNNHDLEIARRFWDNEETDKKELSDEDLIKIYNNIKDITDLII